MKGILYKFNPDSECTEERIKKTREYRLMCKLDRGEKPTMDELMLFRELWDPDKFRTGRIKLWGWLFDFSPYFKRYLVNVKYYGWSEVQAYNKTMIRELSNTPSWIKEIVEVPKKGDK